MDWPVLQALTPADRQAVLDHARRRRFDRHEIVFHEAEPGDSVHLVAEGRLAAQVTTPLGNTAMLGVLRPGDVFGELALLSGSMRRTATVVALEPAETLVLLRETFDRLRQGQPSIDRFLTEALAAQVERLTTLLLEGLFLPAETRVLRRLLDLVEAYREDGGATVTVPLTQEDLANLAGTSRPTVNRVLRAAEADGLVALGRRSVAVLDAGALAGRAPVVPAETAEKIGFRAALASRDFRCLLVALGVSRAGDFIYGVALLVWVFEETRSPTWVAAASLLRLLPYALLAPIGGAVADRYDRRTVLIASDVIRAVMMVAITVAVTASAPVLFVLILAFCSTVASTAYNPAIVALTPAVVGESALGPANAVISTVDSVAIMVGPALGGVILLVASPELAFAVNAVTFLLSAAVVLLVRSRQERVEAEVEASIVSQVAEGIQAVRQSSGVVVLVLLTMAAAAVYGVDFVVLVLVAEELLDLGSEGVGWLTAAIGVGGVAAGFVGGRIAGGRSPGRASFVISLAVGIPFALLATTNEFAVAFALMAVIGGAEVILDILVTTLLQRAVVQDVLARVSGLIDSVAVAGILLGSLVAPVLVETVGLEATLIISGAIVPVVGVIALRSLLDLDRETRHRLDELAPRIAVYDAMSIFDGVPRASLEAMAGAAEEVAVPVGTDVVREGERADHFYVVRAGVLDVMTEDEEGPVRTLGEGDHFGEIGLLERVPRTATVRARDDAVVDRIGGDEFIAAVTAPPVLPSALVEVVTGRLARTHPGRRAQVSEEAPS